MSAETTKSTADTSTTNQDENMSQSSTVGGQSFASKLYTGTGAFPIIEKRRIFYILAAIIVAGCLLTMALRGFTFGIDFSGGTKITMPASQEVEISQVEDVVKDALGSESVDGQIVGTGNARVAELQTGFLDSEQIRAAKQALLETFQPRNSSGEVSVNAIGDSARSETWGGQVTEQALIALLVFLAVVSLYLTLRFQWDMTVAALVCLMFDLTVTAGVYSLVGWVVSPATVIGLLTILGFSLYDTVVVFDKVQENTRGTRRGSGLSFADNANLAVNQTLMRSINTTVIGLLPIIALAVIAVGLLGVGTLKDLALVQIVGIAIGTFSSVFIATPLLVTLRKFAGKAD